MPEDKINKRNFGKKGATPRGLERLNFSTGKWVALLATPFIILTATAIFGLIRLANNQNANLSQNSNTEFTINSNINVVPVNINISIREDSDFDNLIDYLEMKLGTGITTYDTDEDTYLDGEEVKTGFSPRGRGTFNGQDFLVYCQSHFKNTDKLDYSKICSLISEYIEIIRRMAQDESGGSDKDLDQMVYDFCLNNSSDREACEAAIDVALALYMQGATEFTNESINAILNTNSQVNSNTNS